MTDHTWEALIASECEVRPLEDARSQFYFANRELIETWAGLRTDASAQLAERLFDMVDRLSVDLADLGEPSVVVEPVRAGGHGRVTVTREEWRPSAVSLSIEWEANPLNSKGEVRVYACVRLPNEPVRPREDVDRLTETLRTAMPGWTRTPPRWPVWRYIKPTSVTVQDIVGEARRDFLRLWTVAAEIVDHWAREVLPPGALEVAEHGDLG